MYHARALFQSVRRSKSTIFFLLVFVILAGIASAQVYVKPAADGGNDSNSGADWANAFATIQNAVNNVDTSNEVRVATGTYAEGVTLAEGVKVYGGYNATSGARDTDATPTTVTIQGLTGVYHAFYANNINGVVIDGFVIADCDNSAELDGENQKAPAIYIDGASGTINDCDIVRNTAKNRGAVSVISNYQETVISNCNFLENDAEAYGGAMFIQNFRGQILDCVFDGNFGTGGASLNGAAIFYNNGGAGDRQEIVGCTFSNNTYRYGTIFFQGADSTPLIQDCLFEGNSGFNGIDVREGAPVFEDCIFQNMSHTTAAAMALNGASTDVEVTVSNCQFLNLNGAVFGGVFYAQGAKLNMTGSTVTNCTAGGTGGGFMRIYADGCDISITDTTIDSCQSRWGGGIRIESGATPSTLTMTGCTVTNCVTDNVTAYDGGFLLAESDVAITLTDCVFEGNEGRYGGAFSLQGDTASLSITGSEFHSNLADDYGGALYLASTTTTLSVTDSQFFMNRSNQQGGAVYLLSESAVFEDSDFVANWAMNGSALYLDGPSTETETVDFTGCVFGNNNSQSDGGAIRVVTENKILNFDRCTISSNWVGGWFAPGRYGGFLEHNVAGHSYFENCIISANAANRGGAVATGTASVSVINCTVAENWTTNASQGSAFRLINMADPGRYVLNNVVANNVNTLDNGTFTIFGTTDAFNNNMFLPNDTTNVYGNRTIENLNPLTFATGNTSGTLGFVQDSAFATTGTWTSVLADTPAVGYTTLVDDAAAFVPEELVGQFVNANLQNIYQSYITSATATSLIIAGDGFDVAVAAPDNEYKVVDYRLMSNSEAIDGVFVAPPAGVTFPTEDRLAQSRPADSALDIGAYEARAVASIDTDSVNFGNQDVLAGASVPQTITITNMGGVELDYSGAVTGDSGDFQITGGLTGSIGYEQSAQWSVTFDPTTIGDKLATLTLTLNDPDLASVAIPLTGRGQDREIVVTPDTAFDFGSQDPDAGPTAPHEITIQNTGEAGLAFTQIELTAGDTDQFILAGNSTATLAAGASRVLSVVFDPDALGTKATTLTISSNDSDEGTIEIGLTGDCIGSPEIDVQPAALNFGNYWTSGTIAQLNVTIDNLGSENLTFTGGASAISISGAAFSIVGTPDTSDFAPSDPARTVTVQFAPTTQGRSTGVLTIQSNDDNEATVEVPLSGGLFPAASVNESWVLY